MATPAQGNKIPPGAVWAADNGKFGKGWPGPDRWWAWLVQHAARAADCLFAVAPDVPMDAVATLAESRPWLPRIRSLGYPAAFAAQDGSEADGLIPWGEFDVLFLAGSTDWKLGPAAADLAAEARRRGLTVHMGRVNSRRRLRIAEGLGCTSADGTYLAFGPDRNLPRLLDWLEEMEHQPTRPNDTDQQHRLGHLPPHQGGTHLKPLPPATARRGLGTLASTAHE